MLEMNQSKRCKWWCSNRKAKLYIKIDGNKIITSFCSAINKILCETTRRKSTQNSPYPMQLMYFSISQMSLQLESPSLPKKKTRVRWFVTFQMKYFWRYRAASIKNNDTKKNYTPLLFCPISLTENVCNNPVDFVIQSLYCIEWGGFSANIKKC